MQLAAKTVVALILAMLAAWSVFGFLASGEPGNESTRLAWRVAYSAMGVAALAGIAWLFWQRKNGRQSR